MGVAVGLGKEGSGAVRPTLRKGRASSTVAAETAKPDEAGEPGSETLIPVMRPSRVNSGPPNWSGSTGDPVRTNQRRVDESNSMPVTSVSATAARFPPSE